MTSLKNMKKQKGFTLIELLVVITIIGLLSTIVLVSMKEARVRAKISKAKEEVIAIHKSIVLMEIETGRYPVPNNVTDFSSILSSYLEYIGDDPWDNPYFYDGCPEPCSSCSSGNCEIGIWATSVCSGGSDGVISSHNRPPINDDICIYFRGGTSW